MKNLLASILASAVITTGLLWVYDQHFAVKIAVIDMDGYVSRLKSDYMKGKLPKEELDANLQKLSRQIVSAQPTPSSQGISDMPW